MQYYKIDSKKPDPKLIKKALECLHDGGLIVYPTDTLYALGIDVFNRDAVDKLYLIKQRNMRKPVSIMMPSLQLVKELFGFERTEIRKDMAKLLPGKITAVIKNMVNRRVPVFEEAGNKKTQILDKIGIRVPNHPVSKRLARLFDSPISCTSANVSGLGDNFSIKEVISHFGKDLDLILDAGPIKPSKGSTVIDFTTMPYRILRDGDLSLEDLSRILGEEKVMHKREKYVITFVCSGNICRSPMAEAIFKKMISKTKYRSYVKVQSAGTLNLPPSPAHEHSIQVAAINDVDLSGFVSQPVSKNIVEESDLLLVMAQNHFSYFVNNFPKSRHKFFLIKQWHRKQKVSIPSIADPIGHSFDFFKNTYSEIHHELKRLLPYILAEVKKFVEVHG